MSDRLNFYFRQKVTEAELDQAFDGLEQADKNYLVDSGQVGVYTGLIVTQRAAGANLSVDVSAGTAYDPTGLRMRVPTTQNLNVAVDSLGVTTTVSGVGNSKVVSVFIRAKRALSDPRTDGNSDTVYFVETESFEFYVKQGAEAASGSELPPALEPDMILLADIRRTNGVGTIVDAEIQPYASNRRQDTFIEAGATYDLRAGTIKDAVEDILAIANDVASNLGTLQSAVTTMGTDVTASKVVTDSISRERAAVVTKTAAGAIGDDEQSVYLNITGGGLITLPDPAANAGREYYFRLSTDESKVVRFMPFGSELINGRAGGYPGNIPGAGYLLKSDGTNWEARTCYGGWERPDLRHGSAVVVIDTGGFGSYVAGTVCQVYGTGFNSIDAVHQNAFDIGGVGGSWVLHDDGWITVTVGGGGGGITLEQLVEPDSENPNYDGSTYRSSGIWPVATGIAGIP